MSDEQIREQATRVEAIAPPVDIPPAECVVVGPLDPCTIVIFGASGDLTSRKLMPALYNLYLNDGLPKSFVNLVTLLRNTRTFLDGRNLPPTSIINLLRTTHWNPLETWQDFSENWTSKIIPREIGFLIWQFLRHSTQ
jgi:hypothetical protein